MKLNYLTFTLLIIFSLSLFSFTTADPIVLQTQDDTELEAIFDQQAKFQPNNDGYVVIEFKLTRDLNDHEKSEVDELRTENAERIEINVDGSSVKVKLIGNLNNSGVWAKVFYTMGISQYTFGSAAEQIKQPFDVFANHFNLQ